MKSYDEFIVWFNENFYNGDAVFGGVEHTALKQLYKVYEEGYFDGYDQRGIDDEEDESWFGEN
jgi:hypothetical protein